MTIVLLLAVAIGIAAAFVVIVRARNIARRPFYSDPRKRLGP